MYDVSAIYFITLHLHMNALCEPPISTCFHKLRKEASYYSIHHADYSVRTAQDSAAGSDKIPEGFMFDFKDSLYWTHFVVKVNA